MKDKKIKILFAPSDGAGVGHFRSIWPAQQMEKEYSDEIYVEINSDFVSDPNYYKQFDIVHFHRQLGPYDGMQALIAELRKYGVIVIMDIDDYWVPPKTHPLYIAAIKDKLPEKITAAFKLVDYVTTTTDIFAGHIRKYNHNVHVIPNAIDLNHRMWKDVDTKKTDKLRFSWIGGSCFDNKTEILTNEGFKLFKDLNGKETVACLNPSNNNLEFHKPLGYIKKPFNGKLNCGINNLIDYAVTPNHNMYVSLANNLSKKELDFKLIQSQNLTNKNMHFKKDAIWEGVKQDEFEISKIYFNEEPERELEIIHSHSLRKHEGHKKIENRNEKYYSSLKLDMNLWLKFFGFWMAEGWTSSTPGLFQVGVAQTKNNGYLEEMFDTLKKLGFNPTYTKDLRQVRVFDKRLWVYLSQFGKAENKYVPTEILRLCPSQLSIFLEWYLKGDGSQEKGGKRFDKRIEKIVEYNSERKRAYTVSKVLADNIQEICLKLGLISTVTNRGKKNSVLKDGRKLIAQHDAYVISIGSNGIRNKKNPLLKAENQFQIDYNDYVYCVEVPDNIIFVRRNGKTMWCGNSHLNDLEILQPSMNILHNDKSLQEKYQLVMCGYDVRGFMTEVDQDGKHVNTRKILPSETVWNRFEEIFTNNYNPNVISEDYKKYLLKYSNEEYKGADVYKGPYIRRWTLPLTRYGEHYNFCDVCLAPLAENTFNEVKSELKIIEAGLKRKVLIAQDYSVYKELITNGVNGILINKKNNTRGWYEAIKYLINHPEKVKELSDNLYDFVIKRYTLDIVTKQRVEFYKDIIKQKETENQQIPMDANAQ